MTGQLEDMALRFEGLNDDDIAWLNAAIPRFKRWETMIEQEWPQLSKDLQRAMQCLKKIEATQQQFNRT